MQKSMAYSIVVGLIWGLGSNIAFATQPMLDIVVAHTSEVGAAQREALPDAAIGTVQILFSPEIMRYPNQVTAAIGASTIPRLGIKQFRSKIEASSLRVSVRSVSQRNYHVARIFPVDMPREKEAEEFKFLRQQVVTVLKDKGGCEYVQLDADRPTAIKTGVMKNEKQVDAELEKVISAKGHIRYFLYDGHLVTMRLSEQSLDRRANTVNAFAKAIRSFRIQLAEPGLAVDSSSYRKFRDSTEALFRSLSGHQVWNDDLSTLYIIWNAQLLGQKVQNLTDPVQREVVSTFISSVERAAKPRDPAFCRLTVTASGGDGALIKIAKLADANRGKEFDRLGYVIASNTVEKAEYIVRVFRDGRQTSRDKKNHVRCISDIVDFMAIEQ